MRGRIQCAARRLRVSPTLAHRANFDRMVGACGARVGPLRVGAVGLTCSCPSARATWHGTTAQAMPAAASGVSNRLSSPHEMTAPTVRFGAPPGQHGTPCAFARGLDCFPVGSSLLGGSPTGRVVRSSLQRASLAATSPSRVLLRGISRLHCRHQRRLPTPSSPPWPVPVPASAHQRRDGQPRARFGGGRDARLVC